MFYSFVNLKQEQARAEKARFFVSAIANHS